MHAFDLGVHRHKTSHLPMQKLLTLLDLWVGCNRLTHG
jgi:hypothetical protein